jgi:hypothetical protein
VFRISCHSGSSALRSAERRIAWWSGASRSVRARSASVPVPLAPAVMPASEGDGQVQAVGGDPDLIEFTAGE